MTLSLHKKIGLLVAILLLVSAAVPLAALSGALEMRRLCRITNDQFLVSLRAARRAESAFMRYDDLIFRFSLTNDRSWLDGADRSRGDFERALALMDRACDTEVGRAKLASLRGYWAEYEQDARRRTQGDQGTEPSRARATDADAEPSLRDQIDALCEQLIATSEDELRDFSRKSARSLEVQTMLSAGLLVISVGTAFLIVLVAHRTVFRPLRRLTRGIAEFRRGNMSHRVAVESEDEIGVIAAGLNELAESVEREHHQLEEASTTDGLTGLANSRYFWRRAHEETRRATRQSSCLSLLLIDVDLFKEYNDTHGHRFGDRLLKNLGRLLKDSMRAEDLVARYGGEEFAVLLPGSCLEEATAMAERLRLQVARANLTDDDGGQPLTISTGVAQFVPEMISPSVLVEAADRALYRAKGSGRNRVCHEPLAAYEMRAS